MTNTNDDKYINLSIQWTRRLMKPMGLWPASHKLSPQKKLFHSLINVTCFALISFIFVPCGMYVILEVDEFYTKLKLFAPLIFLLMSYGKYYCLLTYNPDIRECIERIEWDWHNITHDRDRDIMVANANLGKRLATFCSIFMCSCFVFYYIVVPVNARKVQAEDKNLTFIPVVYPLAKVIVDARQSPFNEIIFSIQMCGGILLNALTAAACSLAAVLAAHACGQMEVLICWLNHLIDGREDMHMNVNERIANVVNQHVRILKFLTTTEKTLNQVSLIEFLGCTLMLCLVGYCTITEWASNNITATITYVIVLVTFTFNIFIFCYIGELVTERWTMIGKMSYMSNWYQILGKQKLSFLLIIAMSNTSKTLTAGNVMVLSLESFSSVMKTTFAFFNMLRVLI